MFRAALCPGKWGKWTTATTSSCISARRRYPAPAGHGAGAALHQRGEHPGGELRPDGDGGPVHGPPHPAAAGPEIPGAGGGRPARPVEPEDIVILMRSPGQAGGLYGGSAAGEYPCTSGESEAFFSTPEVAVMVSFFADHRQSPAGCAADRRAAVAAVRLSADRLALIRGCSRGDYYDALCRRRHEDSQAFLERWRSLRRRPGTTDGGPAAVEAVYGLAGHWRCSGPWGWCAAARQSAGATPTPGAQAQAAAGQDPCIRFCQLSDDLMERPGPADISARQVERRRTADDPNRSEGLGSWSASWRICRRAVNRDDFQRPVWLVHPRLGLGTGGWIGSGAGDKSSQEPFSVALSRD